MPRPARRPGQFKIFNKIKNLNNINGTEKSVSKSDKLKAKIAFHEKMFFAALAAIFAVTGWAVNSADRVSDLMLLGAALIVIFGIGFGIWNYRQIQSLIEDLEDA